MSNVNATATAESYWDRLAIPRVPIAEAMWHIELSLLEKQTRGVICLIGDAGEGKSQVVAGIAEKHKAILVDIRTAQYTMMGAGVPTRPDEALNRFKVALPSYFPQKDDEQWYIIHFDEINQGQPHAISMFFQLLEDRRFFDDVLPKNCIIVCSMNPATAQYNVSRIEGNAAINRRLLKFFVYSTYADWRRYAETPAFHRHDVIGPKPCHPWVLKYLSARPAMLYAAKDRESGKQFACPATWQTASLSMYLLEKVGESLKSDRSFNRLAATLNTVTALELVEFIRNNETLLLPEEILGKYKKNSELRKNILKLYKGSDTEEAAKGSDALAAAMDAIFVHLFSTEPEPEKVAESLALFALDMAKELGRPDLGNIYSRVRAHAKEGKSNAYLGRLTQALMKHPEFIELDDMLDKAMDEAKAQDTGSNEKAAKKKK